MEFFRFTLFNNVTLFVMALTMAMAVVRARVRPQAIWPLVYYALVFGYAAAFHYSLNLLLLAAGLACAVLVRWMPRARSVARMAECGVLAYVFARSAALLLMW